MPLHLQHHKSYHPYNRENIERVRRDEELAKAQEQEAEQQSLVADSEARIELLRQKRAEAVAGSDRDGRLKAAERELDGKTGSLERFDEAQRAKIGAQDIDSAKRNHSGHINFWADLEQTSSSSSSSVSTGKRSRDRVESEADARRRKLEEQGAWFLGKPAKDMQPWYTSEDLKSGQERKKTEEQRLEEAYKDGVRKSSADPLKQMPQPAKGSSLSHLSGTSSSPSTSKSPGSTSMDELRAQAAAREAAERAKADALIAQRQRAAGFRIEETPVRTAEGYSDQFNREDVRAAKEASRHRQERHWREEEAQARKDFQSRPELTDPGGDKVTLWDGQGDQVIMAIEEEGGMEETGIRSTDEGDMTTMTIVKKEEASGVEDTLLAEVPDDEESMEAGNDDSFGSSEQQDGRRRPRESMYPAILGEIIATVLEHEDHLFAKSEHRLLRSYFDLDYESRHLLARLIQRRPSWHRVDKLRYNFDVKDVETAVNNLCSLTMPALKKEEGEQDEGDVPRRFCLGTDDMCGGEEEALGLLSLDELKSLAKNMNRLKGSATTTKASLIASLLVTKGQGTLFGFANKSKVNVGSVKKGDDTPRKDPKQPTLFATGSRKKQQEQQEQSQSAVLRQQLAVIIGGCVKLCPNAKRLIDRVALVYYRGMHLGGSALTTAVLSRSRRRNFPAYEWVRSKDLFVSRKHLVAYEGALAIETQMDELIEWDGSREGFSRALKLFEGCYGQWQEAVAEVLGSKPQGIDRMTYHRMRFHPGWPLTRIVYKGASVMGRFKLYAREKEVLTALLDQRVFRRGRRGDWYDRLALVLAHYPSHDDARKARREALAVAVAGIEDADTHLIYHDTLQKRIVRLENQLKLPFSEKHDFYYAKLKRCEEKHFKGTRLDVMMPEKMKTGIFGVEVPVLPSWRKAKRPSIDGKRSASDSSSTSSTSSASDGQTRSASPATVGFRERAPLRKVVKVEKRGDSEEQVQIERREVKADMHSVWRGLDGQPCRVEMLVLQEYMRLGYKGFHCEGGVLTMLFTLVMWDVVFAPLEGAFETPYQRQPLDLDEDSFAIARAPLIRDRLAHIEETGGLDKIAEADDRERPNKTWAMACRWDSFNKVDLLEIAECMGGRALSVVCQTLAEEWGHCTSGLPDLVVWRYEDKKVRFCEVKGPGDRLSDKQKVWIDILSRAGCQVEVSLVSAH